MVSPNYKEAVALWTSFRDEVFFKQRFFLNHPFLERLAAIAATLETSITPGRVFYRARIIDESAINEHMVSKCYGLMATEEDQKRFFSKVNKFRGLSKEGSYVPIDPKLIRDARSNPKFIRYLYVAESPTTAVYEVRPILYNSINVAGIEVKDSLQIANIAVDIDLSSEKSKSVDEWLLGFIQSAFSSPINNPDEYIPSQIIAEYFRHLGFDGIRYSSSLHKGGYNLTIYDISKCEAVFSTDLRFEDMKISLRPALGAENIDGRFQWIVDNVPKRFDYETMRLVDVDV